MRNADKIKDLTGQKFNMLTVLGLESRNPIKWRCQCDCGCITYVRTSNLVGGKVKSCGCLSHVGNPKHNLYHTRIYRIYRKMLRRCYSEDDIKYPDYGGRGIKMCDEWRNSVEAFYEWAISNGYKDGLSIDRIDNNGDYTPDNCRWADNEQQANNRRSNVLYTFRGKTMNLSQWCKAEEMPYYTVRRRLMLGWSFEDAITYKKDARIEKIER